MSRDDENKNGGVSWELDCVKKLLNIGYENIGTSMLFNQEKDRRGIDITSWDDELYGKFPFNIQCKRSSNVKYKKILDDITEENTIGVVFQHNPSTGTEYAILKLNDFLQLITKK
jgi:hypothetical protein